MPTVVVPPSYLGNVQIVRTEMFHDASVGSTCCVKEEWTDTSTFAGTLSLVGASIVLDVPAGTTTTFDKTVTSCSAPLVCASSSGAKICPASGVCCGDSPGATGAGVLASPIHMELVATPGATQFEWATACEVFDPSSGEGLRYTPLLCYDRNSNQPGKHRNFFLEVRPASLHITRGSFGCPTGNNVKEAWDTGPLRGGWFKKSTHVSYEITPAP